MFLIHLLAWPCGSISSGQRRALDTMMPLSMENESLGSPSMVQSRILTGSPSTVTSLRVGVGMRGEERGFQGVVLSTELLYAASSLRGFAVGAGSPKEGGRVGEREDRGVCMLLRDYLRTWCSAQEEWEERGNGDPKETE
jgi:hypothetical protein